MNQSDKCFWEADALFKKMKQHNIALFFDNLGNIVAKGRKGQAVVFSNQFEGSPGEQELKKAKALCKEFEIFTI